MLILCGGWQILTSMLLFRAEPVQPLFQQYRPILTTSKPACLLCLWAVALMPRWEQSRQTLSQQRLLLPMPLLPTKLPPLQSQSAKRLTLTRPSLLALRPHRSIRKSSTFSTPTPLPNRDRVRQPLPTRWSTRLASCISTFVTALLLRLQPSVSTTTMPLRLTINQLIRITEQLTIGASLPLGYNASRYPREAPNRR